MDYSMSHSIDIKVTVPRNAGPGRELIIQAPDGRKFSAVVPTGCEAGSSFLVRCPPLVAVAVAVAVAPTYPSNARQQNQQQQQQQNQQQQQQSAKVQKIKVPPGKRRKGDKFKVRLPDGRTIDATVPSNNCKEFYLDTSTKTKQQKQQNWHDNPLAVLPMAVGPFL